VNKPIGRKKSVSRCHDLEMEPSFLANMVNFLETKRRKSREA